MSNLLVVEGCTLTGKVSIDNDTTVGLLPASITMPLVKCNGNKVYNTISYTATYGSYTGSGIMTANSNKTKASGLSLILDNAESEANLTNLSSPYDKKKCKVTIKTAGQTKARAI